MHLKKHFEISHSAVVAVMILMLMLTCQHKIYGQGRVVVSEHKATYEDKRSTLEALWDKRVGWYPAGRPSMPYDTITLTLPESAFNKGPVFLDTLSYFYAQIYDVYALRTQPFHPDSVMVGFVKTTDTLKVAYVAVYPLRLLRKKRLSGADLCLALSSFSNNLVMVFQQPGELIIQLSKYDQFLPTQETWYHAYISQMAGIMGKYFLPHVKKYKRLLILWVDTADLVLHSFSEPHSPIFKNFTELQ